MRDRLFFPLDIGDVLDYTIKIFIKNFKSIIIISSIVYIPIIVIVLLFSFNWNYLQNEVISLQNMFDANELNNEMPDYNSLQNILISLFIAFVEIILMFFVQPILDAAVIRISYNEIVFRNPFKNLTNIDFQKSKLKFFKKEFIQIKKSSSGYGWMLLNNLVFWVIVFTFITIVSILLQIIIIFFVLLSSTTNIFNSIYTILKNMPIVVTFILVVFLVKVILLFVITLLYFILRFSFGQHVIVLERCRNISSITRSFKITKIKFGDFIFAFIFGTALFCFVWIALYAMPFLVLAFDSSKSFLAFSIAYFASEIVKVFFRPFMNVLMTVMFVYCKIVLEGFDIELKFDKLLEKESS